tara:strand:+ start:203 stop:457 length:255 start_codon:yes stop_codon:yes gene_type:complete
MFKRTKGYAAGGPAKSKGIRKGGKSKKGFAAGGPTKMKSKGYAAGGPAKSKGMSSGGKNRTRKNTRAVGVAKRGYGKAFINSKR